jgi:amphi-Trp domain-containing protein
MKPKKFEIDYEECRSLDSTVDQLQSLVDGLRSGALTVARGDRRLLFLLKPGAPLEFTLHAERNGERERLELSLEWRSQHLMIGGEQPRPEGARSDEGGRSDPGERAARYAADEEEALADADDLDDADDEDGDLEDEDFDDAAETVRKSNQLAEALRHSLEPQSRH